MNCRTVPGPRSPRPPGKPEAAAHLCPAVTARVTSVGGGGWTDPDAATLGDRQSPRSFSGGNREALPNGSQGRPAKGALLPDAPLKPFPRRGARDPEGAGRGQGAKESRAGGRRAPGLGASRRTWPSSPVPGHRDAPVRPARVPIVPSQNCVPGPVATESRAARGAREASGLPARTRARAGCAPARMDADRPRSRRNSPRRL